MMDQRPVSQKLPAGLAGVLNRPEDNRDSAYFSGTDASSKRQSLRVRGTWTPPLPPSFDAANRSRGISTLSACAAGQLLALEAHTDATS